MSTKVVEISTDEQCKDVIALGQHMFDEMDTDHLRYDPAVIWANWQWLRKDFDRDQMNVFIAYVDDVAVGFILCKSYPYFFSQQRMAIQELWYVAPAFRSSRVAFKLMQAYEQWARVRGCIEVWTGTAGTAFSQQKKVSRVLWRLGYRLTGFYHKKVA